MSVGGNPSHRGPISAYNHKQVQTKQHSIYDELASSADKLVDDTKLYRSQFVDKIYKPVSDTVKTAANVIKNTAGSGSATSPNTTTTQHLNNNTLIEQSRGDVPVSNSSHVHQQQQQQQTLRMGAATTTNAVNQDDPVTAAERESERLKKQVMLRSKL